MKSSVMVRIGFLLLFLVTLTLTMVACSLVTIRVHNQTDETLQTFRSNDDILLVGKAVPGGEVQFEIERYFQKYRIIAKDMDGNMVYSTEFSRDDFKGNTYDVVIPPTGEGAESGDTTAEE